MAADHHPFRSAEARDEYLSYYDDRDGRWPITASTVLVPTTFGDTLVRIQGPSDGHPMVLLPGDTETSLVWSSVVAPLARSARVYAIDHTRDVGRGGNGDSMKASGEFVRWFDELLAGLGIDEVNLVAHSYGGWQAAQYALVNPHRVRRLALLAPSATVLAPSFQLLWRAILLDYVPSRRVVKNYFYWLSPDCVRDGVARAAVDEMVEEQMLARRCFRRLRPPSPTVLSDDELKRLDRTMFLVGENEVIYEADRAVDRLNRVAPQIKTIIAADADHNLALCRPQWLADEVLRFISG